MVDFIQDYSGQGQAGGASFERADANSPVKRLFDIVFASAMLVTFLPILALITLLIVFTDGRNPFFGHKRIGRGGRQFSCLKFRTMVPNADAALQKLLEESPEAAREWAETRKLRNDPRILPVIGTLLRRTSLDELPQILNVLFGDMSIVGPRPVVADELERYGRSKRIYLSVRPGLTGLWQAGNRSDDSYETRVRKDVWYVRNWSMALDLKIVLKTARVFLGGRAPGAY